MLFGNGEQVRMFSTHPPLNERIGRIDKSFKPDDLVLLAKKIQRQGQAEAEQAAQKQEKAKPKPGGAGMFDADNLVDQDFQLQVEVLQSGKVEWLAIKNTLAIGRCRRWCFGPGLFAGIGISCC